MSPLPSGPASSRHAALLAGGHGARGHGTRGQRLCHSGREKPCDVHLKARHSLHARGGTTRPPALPTAARSPTKATKTRKTHGTKWSVGRTLACNVEPLAPPYLGTRAGSVSAARHTSPQRHVSDLGATSKFCREGEFANTETGGGKKRRTVIKS